MKIWVQVNGTEEQVTIEEACRIWDELSCALSCVLPSAPDNKSMLYEQIAKWKCVDLVRVLNEPPQLPCAQRDLV